MKRPIYERLLRDADHTLTMSLVCAVLSFSIWLDGSPMTTNRMVTQAVIFLTFSIALGITGAVLRRRDQR